MRDYQKDELSPTQMRLHEKLRRDLGEPFLAALHDPKTIEIMLNADGVIWQERLGESMRRIGRMTATRAEAVLRTIAAYQDTTIARDRPVLEGAFPLDGSRFAGQLPPVVSAPTFAVRKKAVALFSLDQYVSNGTMTSEQKEVIHRAVRDHRNIVVTGGTGSGKTTLTNAIINEMVLVNPEERIVIIEDTGEIQCVAPNFIQYHTTLDVTLTQLLKTTLRMRPDRILVGEVRGPEALDLLMAWNTGHEGGVVTLHANSARSALDRLYMLVSMHPDSPTSIEPLIAEAVHLIVHIVKTPAGRRVRDILGVAGYSAGAYITHTQLQ